MFGIEEDSGFIFPLLGDDIVEELELDFRVFIVVDPAIRSVEVLPSVVVKVSEDGSPEPAHWIGIRLERFVRERTVSFVAQQRVAGRHLLKNSDKSQSGLL